MKKAQLTKIVKAVVNKNSVLPILENVVLENERLEISDLENFVSIPFKTGVTACFNAAKFLTCLDMMETPAFTAKDGMVYIKEGKRTIQVCGDPIEKFPVFAFKRYYADEPDAELHEAGFLDTKAMQHMETALKFTSDDDLRPAMTGIYINDEIVSTDAHRLFHAPIEPFTVPVIIPAKTCKVLLLIGGTWQVFANKDYAIFMNQDQVFVSCRLIDGNYPQYKVVIPTGEGLLQWQQDVKELRTEIKHALKFANTVTNQVTFSLNGKAKISSQDKDFKHGYDSELSTFHLKKIKIESLDIAFNGKFLDEILAESGKDVTIRLWTDEKAVLINDNFLLMPLILNK